MQMGVSTLAVGHNSAKLRTKKFSFPHETIRAA